MSKNQYRDPEVDRFPPDNHSPGATPERVAELKALAGEGSMDERVSRLAQALRDGTWEFSTFWYNNGDAP